MFILSKIIAKEWFKSLIGSLVVLFILVTVGDIINGFLRNYETSRIFLEYILKMPEMMGKMMPICALLASLFSMNKLKAHSELIAILAGGYSAKRIYQLIFVCSLTLGSVQFYNLSILQPKANLIKRENFEKSRRNESKYLARSSIGGTGMLWYKSDNYFASFSAYDRENQELRNVSLYFQNKNLKLQTVHKATSAIYTENSQWKFTDLVTFTNLDNADFPKVQRRDKFTFTLQEKPSDFGQFESDITTLNFFDLFNFISRLQSTGINSSEYEIMLLEKVSLSLICIVFSLFPLSSIFNPNRRASSFGKNVVFTLIFSIAFWLGYSSIITFGVNGKLSPIVATMSIPVLFIIYIAYTYHKNRTL